MKEWIPLLQTLIEGLFLLLQKLVWPGLILIFIMMFSSQFRELLGVITKWIAAIKSVYIGKGGITLLSEDLRDIDKISKEEKNKAVTELAQKREKDYVYEDWHNAAFIAYIEKRYEVALRDFSQALQYAKTKEQTANALLNQGIVLWQLKRSEEALRIFKQVNERYGKDTEPGIREQVAGALVNQGVVLGELDRSEEEIQVYKQVDERYGKDAEPDVREQVAKALVNQGVVLGKLGRFEEAIQILKQVNARYGKDTDPGVREQVANALFNQGVVLWKMDRFEEAVIALRKAEVIFAALGMTENKQQARKFIEQWEKEKANK